MATKTFQLLCQHGISPQAATEVPLSLFLLISNVLLLECVEKGFHHKMQQHKILSFIQVTCMTAQQSEVSENGGTGLQTVALKTSDSHRSKTLLFPACY